MLAYLFVIFAVLFRIFPHTLGFTPVIAALLFFGSRMSRRQLAIPFVLLAASDVFLTKFYYGYPFTPDHVASWMFYAAVLFLGTTLSGEPKPLKIAGAALGSSVAFFIVSNFAVWTVWNMYPKNFGGLVACYIAGIPFFRNALAGDMFFTAVMFSIPVLIGAISGKHRTAEL
jgi:hypothetical protein